MSLTCVPAEDPLGSDPTVEKDAPRFERAGASADGSGLGLAIVSAIADRIGSSLVLRSPRPGSASVFEVIVTLPAEGSKASIHSVAARQ